MYDGADTLGCGSSGSLNYRQELCLEDCLEGKESSSGQGNCISHSKENICVVYEEHLSRRKGLLNITLKRCFKHYFELFF